jgi:hypothetical protein
MKNINNMTDSVSPDNNKIDITKSLELHHLGSIPLDEEIANFNFSSSIKLFESTYNELKIII